MFTNVDIGYIAIVVVSLLISIPIHETMHGLVARWLGDTTAHDEGRLTLNPLRHVDPLLTIVLPAGMLLLGFPPIFVAKPVPFDPHSVRHGEYGAAMVGIAGPLSNLALAIITALFLRVSGLDINEGFGFALAIFTVVNISLFVFNMLPIPPLDGSRLLYAFAPEPVQRVMALLEGFGIMITILILVVLSQWIGPVISNITGEIFTFLLR
jgi:Zn-dependent protease